jgi:ribose transport system permease protein
MVQSGMVFVGVNLYLQPMVLAAIIFLAVMVDAVRSARFARLRRRMLRPD